MTYDSTLCSESPTYHVTSTRSKALKCCPAAGVVITATLALTAGAISDSRATVETIRAFEANRIVYREYFEVDLRAIKPEGIGWTLGEESGKYRRL